MFCRRTCSHAAHERPAAVPTGLMLANVSPTFLALYRCGEVLKMIASGFFRLTANVTPSMNVFLEDSDLAKVHLVWY